MDPGNVVWFEIATSDAEPVQKFYSELLDWTYEIDPDSSINGIRYIRIIAPKAPFPMGAIREAPDQPTTMNMSIISEDVPTDTERLAKLGATVQIPPTQVADVTWFAVLTDPRGNAFSLFSQSKSERFAERMEQGGKAMSEAAYAPTPGAMGWFEIGTTDAVTTQDFYRQAFGWKFELDDSAGGKPYYNIFTTNEWPSGGMYDHGTGGTDYLMPSFLAADVPAVTTQGERLGATIEVAPEPNPDGLVFARLLDPDGNRFGLFSLPDSMNAGN
ncbi:VOC family protein [Nocardia sp. NPDC050406]|uniref:VOC family protein n=1 Tax=Nocardia sp. NPDC050406 TaxID=3364318 RepID=UPI00379D66F8